jgi:hypothetical protein
LTAKRAAWRAGGHDRANAARPHDERILAMTTRLNLMDKRWEELRERKE